jgi:hypothetical protein
MAHEIKRKCMCPVCGIKYSEELPETEFRPVELVDGSLLRPCAKKHTAHEIWLAWRRVFGLDDGLN